MPKPQSMLLTMAQMTIAPYDGQLVVTLAGYPGVSESSPKITKQKGRLG